MRERMWYGVVCLLLAVADGGGSNGEAAEPPRKAAWAPTHVVLRNTAYYLTGPQQATPPDGELAAGTAVRIVARQGSYLRIETADQRSLSVSSDSLLPADPRRWRRDATVRAVVDGSNQFALNLHRHLAEGVEGNLFSSPFSISLALSMTLEGARGQTAEEMISVTGHRDAPLDSRLVMKLIRQSLTDKDAANTVSIANRIWIQQDYPVRDSFLQATSTWHGAEAVSLDFRQAEAARTTINSWVEEQTRSRIQELITPGALDDARLVLTNAVYFLGKWSSPFEKERTRPMPFHFADGNVSAVPTMFQMDSFRYTEDQTVQVLELPYQKGQLSMVIVLPRQKDGLADVERQLDVKRWNAWTDKLGNREVRVWLPRFRLESQFQLNAALQELGMRRAFADTADFSGITDSEELLISDVIHKAFVEVDEQGTEAAAATAVVIAPTAALVGEDRPPVAFRADRPFLFLIREPGSNSILFIGAVQRPGD